MNKLQNILLSSALILWLSSCTENEVDKNANKTCELLKIENETVELLKIDNETKELLKIKKELEIDWELSLTSKNWLTIMEYDINNEQENLIYIDTNKNVFITSLKNYWDYKEYENWNKYFDFQNNNIDYISDKGNCEDIPKIYKQECEKELQSYIDIKNKYVPKLLKLLK